MVVSKADGDVLSGSDWNTSFSEVYDAALASNLLGRRATLATGAYIPETESMLTQPFTSSDHIDTSSISNLGFADSPSTGANYSVFFCKVLDDHEDDILTSSVWNTTSHNAELEGKLRVGTDSATAFTSSATADGGSGVDFKALAGDSEIVCQAVSEFPAAASGFARIRLIDGHGGTAVTLADVPSTELYTYNIVLDKAGGTASIYRNGISQSAVDVSSLSNWYLDFTAGHNSGGNASGFIDVYFEGYLDGTSVTSSYVSTDSRLTAKSSVQNAYVYAELGVGSNSDFGLDLSADGGSGYDTGKSLSTPFAVTNSGTDVLIKLHRTSSTVTAPNRNIRELRGFGVFYS